MEKYKTLFKSDWSVPDGVRKVHSGAQVRIHQAVEGKKLIVLLSPGPALTPGSVLKIETKYFTSLQRSSLYPAELLADLVELHWGDDVERAGVCPALVHLVKSSFELKFYNPDLGTPTNCQNYRSDYLVAGRYLWTHHTTQQKAKHQDWKLENIWGLSND